MASKSKSKTKAKSASAKMVGGAAATKPKASGTVDVLADVAKEVENLTQSKAFSLVEELMQSGGLNEFRLGGVLAMIQDKSAQDGGEAWLDGCQSFRDLVVDKFALHYRKAMYLISIYKNLVEKQIPWDSVKGLGWTKLKELAPVLTPKNVDTWVTKAEKLTVIQLIEAIKKTLNKGSDATNKDTSAVTTMTFKLHEDQKEAVREALDKAKDETKTEFDSVALFNISQGYLGNSVTIGGAAAPDEVKPKAKGKKAQAAAELEANKAALKEAMEAFGDEGAEEVLGVFGEVFPDVQIEATV